MTKPRNWSISPRGTAPPTGCGFSLRRKSLTQNQTLTAGEKQYTLVLVRPVKLGQELLYYKSIAYEQEGE